MSVADMLTWICNRPSWVLGADVVAFDPSAANANFAPGATALTSWSIVPDPAGPQNNDFGRIHQSPDIANSMGTGRLVGDTESDAAIGLVLAGGRFKCNHTHCFGRSFKRPAELRRHYNTTHAVRKPEFWCEVPFCERSLAAGGRPFCRGYRL